MRMSFVKILSILCMTLNLASSIKLLTKQDSTLYVHLISHSHDDVGWLKTVDEYFTGSNPQIDYSDVEIIISSVVDELLKDPAKKFTYAEMKFLSMWWKE